MSKKAPDTRNKLDNNKNSKPKKIKKISHKDLKKETESEKSVLSLSAEKKPSKGEIFKKENGYSKTMKRNMRKSGASSPKDYAVSVRKPRKLAERKVRQKKHADASAYKRANGKKKGGGSQPKAKKKTE
jgi:hypothetical protein